MAKRKFVEELSDEELSKVVENIQSIMVNEMSDEELLKAVKRIESPLFEFESRTVGPRKRWKKNVVVKQRFTARLKELRQPSPSHNLLKTQDQKICRKVSTILSHPLRAYFPETKITRYNLRNKSPVMPAIRTNRFKNTFFNRIVFKYNVAL